MAIDIKWNSDGQLVSVPDNTPHKDKNGYLRVSLPPTRHMEKRNGEWVPADGYFFQRNLGMMTEEEIEADKAKKRSE